MDEHRLSQSAAARARDDAIRAVRTVRFWGAQVILLAVAGPIAGLLAPNAWSNGETAWFAAGVAITAALVVAGFTYVGCLVAAPYRQRDEARQAILGQPRLALEIEGRIGMSRPMREEAGDDPIDEGNMLWVANNVLAVNKSESKVVLKPRLQLLPSDEMPFTVNLNFGTRCKIEALGPVLPHCSDPLILDPVSAERVHLDFMVGKPLLDLIGYGIIARAQTRLRFDGVLSGDIG